MAAMNNRAEKRKHRIWPFVYASSCTCCSGRGRRFRLLRRFSLRDDLPSSRSTPFSMSSDPMAVMTLEQSKYTGMQLERPDVPKMVRQEMLPFRDQLKTATASLLHCFHLHLALKSSRSCHRQTDHRRSSVWAVLSHSSCSWRRLVPSTEHGIIGNGG